MEKFTTMPPFLLISLSILFSHSIAGDTLIPTQSLADGENLVSAGGSFAWVLHPHRLQEPILRHMVQQHPNSNSSMGRQPATSNHGLHRKIDDRHQWKSHHHQSNSTIIWSSPTTSVKNPVAQILDSGNLVVKEENSSNTQSFAWQSFDHPTDTLLPGMKLGWNLTSHTNRNITAWTSDNDPSPGEYCVLIDNHGDPQVFLYAGPVKKWRAGPWNGLRLSGIPEIKTFNGFNVEFINNKDEISLVLYLLDQSIKTRLVVNQSGVVQRLVWLDKSNEWNLFWNVPTDECDKISPCGPYGVCDPNNSPICKCLQGFDPKSPEQWNLRDGSDGCVRMTELDCRNRTDGFVTVKNLKVPDTSNSTVNKSMSLDECRAMCLTNCSCTAYASANISGSGSGCIIWATELTDIKEYTNTGQDLYVRLAKADLGSAPGESHKSGHVNVAVLLSLVLVTLLLACIGSFIWIKKRRIRAILGTGSFTEDYTDESVRGNDLDLPLFALGVIVAATNNFSEQNKLGEGGFGPVYKGNLEEGQEIAVKRLAKTSLQGDDEFKNEVMLIAKLQHRNLVRLLGCCIHEEERLLIYEYMPNKSLDAFLFGIARGLLYLHQDSRYRIIHRDLKAGNILLDKGMNPKISDFGLARIFEGDVTKANTRRVVGTYGYMSPEYAMDGIYSVKSDVFSFGVLVLEIISGKKNRGVYQSESHLNLLGEAWRLWNEGHSLKLVDESLGKSFSMNEAMRCIKVGLLCVQERPEDRPTMSSVVLMLGNENSSLLHPKHPGFVPKGSHLGVESSSSKRESCTANEVTLTMVVGR